ncbi:MAG TPA: hypothetical protein VL240_04940 [Candidatus Binatia bacterium]|nr:hypothetical protein [Candidatus Binatia bacterium]
MLVGGGVSLLAAERSLPSPSSPIYVITNDDGVSHNYVSFFAAGGTPAAPTLTFASDIITRGRGIGGGFFGTQRINLLPDAATHCVYASNAGSGEISAIDLTTNQLAGNFPASPGDAGDSNGIGIVLNANYLYAAYTASNTIATFSVQPGCQLSFLEDVSAAGLNGGSVAGMALHGDILVVAYADGSIESFNIANGLPQSNGDAQNSTAYIRSGIYFPESVDISPDGHFAIFGDSSLATIIEVSDISSGRLTPTLEYTVSGVSHAVGVGINSAALRLSPDGTMIFLGDNDGGSVAAAFFDARTGRVSGGCTSSPLGGFYNPWAFVGSVATRDNTGTGGVLYVAEYGFTASYIGIVKIASDGTLCTLTESPASEVPDLLSDGLLSITVFPPRPF